MVRDTWHFSEILATFRTLPWLTVLWFDEGLLCCWKVSSFRDNIALCSSGCEAASFAAWRYLDRFRHDAAGLTLFFPSMNEQQSHRYSFWHS